MKKITITIMIICLLPIIGLMSHAIAEESQEIINSIITALRDSDPNIQFKGFNSIVTFDRGNFRIKEEYRSNPQIKDAMLDLLKHYSTKPFKPGEEGIVFCGEYRTYHCLLGVIGDFKDEKALPFLLENIGEGEVRSSLARYGDVAIAPVVDLLKSGNPIQQAGAATVLGYIVDKKYNGGITEEGRKYIKQSVLSVIDSLNELGIISSIFALGELKDPTLIPFIEKYSAENYSEYVQKAAKRTLEQLKPFETKLEESRQEKQPETVKTVVTAESKDFQIQQIQQELDSETSVPEEKPEPPKKQLPKEQVKISPQEDLNEAVQKESSTLPLIVAIVVLIAGIGFILVRRKQKDSA
ncbi:hypothetical protein WDW89_09960 [Deltaproteobacteria bacterium TL4]